MAASAVPAPRHIDPPPRNCQGRVFAVNRSRATRGRPVEPNRAFVSRTEQLTWSRRRTGKRADRRRRPRTRRRALSTGTAAPGTSAAATGRRRRPSRARRPPRAARSVPGSPARRTPRASSCTELASCDGVLRVLEVVDRGDQPVRQGGDPPQSALTPFENEPRPAAGRGSGPRPGRIIVRAMSSAQFASMSPTLT